MTTQTAQTVVVTGVNSVIDLVTIAKLQRNITFFTGFYKT
ncbi:MAG: hypothetical protein JWR87_3812 [Segetibacter sp.]|jgi:hypothetical protein|nr:hypothetical protein [Segetibacter sp.]